jgi:hypothetical protein
MITLPPKAGRDTVSEIGWWRPTIWLRHQSSLTVTVMRADTKSEVLAPLTMTLAEN